MTTPRRAVGALVLLDANILYPIRLCDFFLTAGTNGMIATPVVSREILAEAQRNVTADRVDIGEERIQRRFDAVRTATTGGDNPIPKRYFDTTIVNEKDRHVLAAARFHDVDFVVTNDARLRNEIDRWISQQHQIHLAGAVAANELVSRFVGEDARQVRAVIQAMAARSKNPPRDFEVVVAGLRRSLPALAALD
jgi:rRNA-processing protein FCF1